MDQITDLYDILNNIIWCFQLQMILNLFIINTADDSVTYVIEALLNTSMYHYLKNGKLIFMLSFPSNSAYSDDYVVKEMAKMESFKFIKTMIN